ncbi:hypothetical protein Q3A66_20285 [Hymenobacter sp. BT770]|uniref:hypothetical protein n=1 Tax=Hymenobacter sp. BT770 TaxID=2886942 RepID=UPI001D1233E2|nr:hypothetical protein [Hymenobacter sp. BT770]MCC3155359.1 hypothetical protein [Hymenobacter sp. BT770]MDO3417413.1 hypothetical protein [Hymenobacter sp. BT770]
MPRIIMPRTPNFPDTTDDVKSISLAYLRESGLLRPGYHVTTLSWSCKGKPSGRITLECHLLPGSEPYLRLKYTFNDTTPLDYRIDLEALPSNLPGHEHRPGRYRMRCPVSGRAATVLYLHGGRGYFAHRLAYGQRLYYESQLMPASIKPLVAPIELDRKLEEVYTARFAKGRKTHYRGKPTRWYSRLLALEAKAGLAVIVGLAHTANGRFNPLS